MKVAVSIVSEAPSERSDILETLGICDAKSQRRPFDAHTKCVSGWNGSAPITGETTGRTNYAAERAAIRVERRASSGRVEPIGSPRGNPVHGSGQRVLRSWQKGGP